MNIWGIISLCLVVLAVIGFLNDAVESEGFSRTTSILDLITCCSLLVFAAFTIGNPELWALWIKVMFGFQCLRLAVCAIRLGLEYDLYRRRDIRNAMIVSLVFVIWGIIVIF